MTENQKAIELPWIMTYNYNGKEFIGGWYRTEQEAADAAFLSMLNGNPGTTKRNPNFKG